MKLTFISNYMNHHQMPFCDACYRALGEDFHFIQVMPMADDRKKLGWDPGTENLPYIMFLYRDEERCRRMLAESDVVFLGWMGDEYDSLAEEILLPSLEKGRPVFRYSERIYKSGQWKFISPRGLAAKKRQHVRYSDAPVYLLCSGAYVASDFSLIHAYSGKMYRWGYFPPFRSYEKEVPQKDDRELTLVWAGRFIPWKHPEYAVRLAETLKGRDLDFRLTMIGDGRLRRELAAEAAKKGLGEQVVFTGALDPDGVRAVMEKSDIFLFTSNYLEGWGAVVNEAMNSRMAVVASDEAGCVPWLIENGKTGISFSGCDYRQFERAALALSENTQEARACRKKLGEEAFNRIKDLWNADTAAERFLAACRQALSGEVPSYAEDDGPMSRAEIRKPSGLMRTLKENRLAEGL